MDPVAVPPGLLARDWSSIRAAYEAGRHAAYPVDGGYAARNPGQRWRMGFDGRGFVVTPDATPTAGSGDGGWSWGLELVQYGRQGMEQGVEAPSCIDAADGRVEYRWGESLTEWFINDPRGLEHGYTVHERPRATPACRVARACGASLPLQFTLAVRGGLIPQVSDDGRSVSFKSTSGAAVVNYAGLKVFDADGAGVPAWFEPSGESLVLSVDDSAACYPLTIDPIAQQAYLKASNTDSGDQFGISVAVSGDTVVVGANAEASNATGVNGNQADNSAYLTGAVYVFVRTGGTWSQQAYLKATNAELGDGFGFKVALSGDTLVVAAISGASNATGVNGNQGNNSAPAAGAAYVFVRSGSLWVQTAYLKASNTGASDQFGISVAVSGDTVVVGANGEDSNATGVNGDQANNNSSNSGAAYVFVRNGTTWTQQAYLKASNTGASDEFGFSVAVSGDTMVIGARGEDSNATGVNGNQANNSANAAGAAYVFVRSGGVWTQQGYLKASNTGGSDNFGNSVAVSGDTVVVGAEREDSSSTGVNGNQANNSAIDSGAAYVFVRSGGIWSQQAYLKASNTGVADLFGSSIAVSGDTVLVGAWSEDSNATGVNGNGADNSAANSGAAYVFVRNSRVWYHSAYLKASNTATVDEFGKSVSLSGDTVVVGAWREASNATGVNGNQANNSDPTAGAVYEFFIPDQDGDGVLDEDDRCPDTPNCVNADGCTSDSDADGVLDGCDACPGTPDCAGVDASGCPSDADGDAVYDGCDVCLDTSAGETVDATGCSLLDEDADGVLNDLDLCHGTPDCATNIGANGCPIDGDGDGLFDGCDQCPGANDLTDSDADGVPDCLDQCPNDAAKVAPGSCGCGSPDSDSDADGVPDCLDQCPNDAAKVAPGSCGCGSTDTDSDGDSVPDCLDQCPNDANKVAPGVCGCSVADSDADGDGVLDCLTLDLCPGDPEKTQPGVCGCGISDVDANQDGAPDCRSIDLCPGDPDKALPGVCGCGTPDTDANGDGIPDCINLIGIAGPTAAQPAPCGTCGAGAMSASLLLLASFGVMRRRQPRGSARDSASTSAGQGAFGTARGNATSTVCRTFSVESHQ